MTAAEDLAAHTAAARRFMIDGQLKPNRVTDPRLLGAMGHLPRERFLPAGLAPRAYQDEDVALPGGRALMEPMVLARLIQLMAIRRGERALVLGSGAGYGAAVLASMGVSVVAVEDDAGLMAVARAVLPALTQAGSITLIEASPVAGHAEGAPYDGIMIEGEVAAVPQAILDQLAEGGRLVTVLRDRPPARHAILARRVGATVTTMPDFDCSAVPLPAFMPAPRFAF
ncbi:protein-L-isoaspartate O-methyltransferase family protein [Plastoroseomonas arctica]|uniref:Protein-L-isoaspartate O-methyltransferase n=1 Tax=Plastoroseomonas arctica TaxID=1509237 RepID=A0AAF1KU68_9PROT|nr:protein-L-isoaspartate O-methyltransferase [Plastoroseomonas arctica]MBR0655587.1 protein-L-isoaspartate O-methyltransferase [Plastoroseomonas arctica]